MRQKMFMDESQTDEKSLDTNVRVGEILSSARNKKKKDIEKIAEKLRIRPQYLTALENSEYDIFPGRIYALGFLKSYAEFLGLDAEDLLARYKEEIKGLSAKPMVMPMPEHQIILPSPKILLWTLGVCAVVWMAWYFLSFSEEKEPAIPPIVTQESPLVEAQMAEAASEAKPEVSASEKKKDEAKSTEKKASAAKKNRVQIRAKEEPWFEILDDDTVVVSKVLKKGETYDVPAGSADMTLKTGNAGGMEVIVDGQVLKPLGPVGSIRSDISLDPEKLKKR